MDICAATAEEASIDIPIVRLCGEEGEASISTSPLFGGSRFEILKMALSFPGPMPPRNLKVSAALLVGEEEGRKM